MLRRRERETRAINVAGAFCVAGLWPEAVSVGLSLDKGPKIQAKTVNGIVVNFLLDCWTSVRAIQLITLHYQISFPN